MQLEDHPGDILRKARKMNGVSAPDVARAAKISETGFAALEDSGKVPPKMNLPALAKIVGLDAKKLKSVFDGWLPAEKNLSDWRHLEKFSTASDGLTVNCFLIWDENSRDAALFDTGLDAQPVLEFLAEKKLQLRHIFITHSHWDHVEALPKFRYAFPAAQIHSNIKAAPKNQHLKTGETFSLGDLKISFRETPGHAPDGTTYFIDGWPQNPPRVAIVGDTILAGSMCNGNGQWEIARQKIHEEILSLPSETLLCPGHGPLTTVGEEIENNPFF